MSIKDFALAEVELFEPKAMNCLLKYVTFITRQQNFRIIRRLYKSMIYVKKQSPCDILSGANLFTPFLCHDAAAVLHKGALRPPAELQHSTNGLRLN